MEAIGSLIAIAALVSFVVGLVGLFKPVRWARIRNRKRAGLVMGVAFVAFLVAGAFLPSPEEGDASASGPVGTDMTGSGDKEAASAETPTSTLESTPTTQPQQPTTTQQATTTTTQTLLAYQILEEEDVSFAGAVRYSLRVTVAEGATRENLRAIAAAIADDYRADRSYNALNIFFYHYPELANDVSTLGSWDDSPHGDWSRAMDVELGDYSTHEPNDQTKEKDWTLLPSQRDATLYATYNDLFYELAGSSDEMPTDDELINLVAEQAKASPEEVEAALDRFLTWIFNDAS